MAPQYFFYNLPSSECKELLQHILDSEVTESGKSKQKTHPVIAETEKKQEYQSYDRCVVQ